MSSQQLVSFGATQSMTGKQWTKMVINGGLNACVSFQDHDIVRIDHFRGFESYWEIPAGSDTAAPGKWVKGPGYKLLQQ